jgi:hypothetical protein
VRSAWVDFYRRGGNVAHTCRHCGISRQTFYRWRRRYDPLDLTTLQERSHCPRRRRQPTWPFTLEGEVLILRLQFPRWARTNWRFFWVASNGRLQLRWSAAFSPNSSGKAGSWKRRARAFRDRAVLSARAPMRRANPGSTRCGRGRYSGLASGAGCGLPTVRRPRRGLALGCDPSPHPRHRLYRR